MRLAKTRFGHGRLIFGFFVHGGSSNKIENTPSELLWREISRD
jgi:hypothetical protein